MLLVSRCYKKGWNQARTPKPSPCDGESAEDGKYADICVGRYLLHVYEGEPENLMGKKGRPWVKQLRSASEKKIDLRVGDDKASTFKKSLSNDLENLTIEAGITNRVIAQRRAAGKTNYLCVLTRIDRFKVTLNHLSWEETEDRQGIEINPGDWRKLQAEVGKHILFNPNVKSKEEDVPPSKDELESYADDVMEPAPAQESQ